MPNSSSLVFENAIIAATGPGVLNGFSGFNNKGSSQYILLFDAKTIPNNGVVPVLPILVQANSSFGIDFGFHGRSFKHGVVICNSSTAATKTIASADCWFDVQFRSAI